MAKASGWERAKDVTGALAFMITGGIVLCEMKAEDLPAQAAKYPSILVYLIFALCVLLITRAALGLGVGVVAVGSGEEGKTGKTGFPTLCVLVLSLLYVAAMPYIGFILSSALMMIAFMLAMGVRSLPVLLLTPAIEITFLWYVFEKLLAVFLPDAEPLRALLGMG